MNTQVLKRAWILFFWPVLNFLTSSVLAPILRRGLSKSQSLHSDSILWFVHTDYISGICALVVFVVCTAIGIITWKRFQPFSLMIIVLTALGGYRAIFRSIIILREWGNPFSKTIKSLPWLDYGAYTQAMRIPEEWSAALPIVIFIFIVLVLKTRTAYSDTNTTD